MASGIPESRSACLSEGLQAHVTDAQLTANFDAAYNNIAPHMPPQLLEHLPAAKEVLLRVPLTHTTASRENAEAMKRNGITPCIDRPQDAANNTYQLDRSLGLDAYTFMFRGVFSTEYYGSAKLLIDSGVLLRDEVMVTNGDILTYVSEEDRHKPFAELDASAQARIKSGYFGGMLRGQDWLTIASMHALHTAYATNGEPTPLTGMPEIKYRGTLPGDAITDIASAADVADLEGAMLANGVMPASVYGQLRYGEQGTAFSEEHLAAGRQVWRDILGIDPSTPPYSYSGKRW